MRKAAFFDRDGVINIDYGYVHAQEDWDWIPGVLDAAKRLHEAGYLLFIVTNQSGIARGMFPEGAFLGLDARVRAEFAACGAPIERTYFCPHHPQASVPEYRLACNCRKPAPGLILQAIRDYDLDPAACVMFGDSPRDMAAAKAAGVAARFLLGKDGKETPAPCPECTHTAKDLKEGVSAFLQVAI